MTTTDDALLPCPFCGDHVAIKPWHNHWCIYHNTNDCLLAPVDDQLFDTYEQAFAAWNRRAGQAHADALLPCPFCNRSAHKQEKTNDD